MNRLSKTDHLHAGSTVGTIGMFDGVHLGHVMLIQALKNEAQARGKQSLVVTFGQHPQHVLQRNPQLKMLQTLDQRLLALESLNPDYLAVLDFTPQLSRMDSEEFMRVLRDCYGMTALIVGYNHRFGHNRGEKFDDYVRIGNRLGIDVIKAPEYLGEFAPVSSTIVRGLIAAGKVDDAMRCMGRPYRLEGTVVHGFHNGRGIGFPTANVGKLDPCVILPHNGAYAVMVHLGDRTLQGMVNVGNRPTLDNGSELSIEVNIFDFDDDIYGQPIALDFVKFLRLEFKLGSIEELRAQLTHDREKSRAILDKFSQF